MNLGDFRDWVSGLFSRWATPEPGYALRSPRHKVEAVYAWVLLSRQGCAESALFGELAIVPGHNAAAAPMPRLVVVCQTAEPVTNENGVAEMYHVDLAIRLEVNHKVKLKVPIDQHRAALILAEIADVFSDLDGLKAMVNDPLRQRPVNDFHLIGHTEGLHLGLPAGGSIHDDSIAYIVSMHPFDCAN